MNPPQLHTPIQLAKIKGIPIWWDGVCLSWLGPLAIDCDGDPACYAPGGKGKDYLANAGRPGNWYGIVTDKAGKPVVQGPNDPRPGYYISTTSYQRREFPAADTRRYIDASKIAGVVIPGFLIRAVPGIVLGCRAYARNVATGGPVELAMVHDAGPDYKVGEGTPYLAERLGLSGNPRKGGGTDKAIIEVRIYPGRQVTLNGETFPLLPYRR